MKKKQESQDRDKEEESSQKEKNIWDDVGVDMVVGENQKRMGL